MQTTPKTIEQIKKELEDYCPGHWYVPKDLLATGENELIDLATMNVEGHNKGIDAMRTMVESAFGEKLEWKN